MLKFSPELATPAEYRRRNVSPQDGMCRDSTNLRRNDCVIIWTYPFFLMRHKISGIPCIAETPNVSKGPKWRACLFIPATPHCFSSVKLHVSLFYPRLCCIILRAQNRGRAFSSSATPLSTATLRFSSGIILRAHSFTHSHLSFTNLLLSNLPSYTLPIPVGNILTTISFNHRRLSFFFKSRPLP